MGIDALVSTVPNAANGHVAIKLSTAEVKRYEKPIPGTFGDRNSMRMMVPFDSQGRPVASY